MRAWGMALGLVGLVGCSSGTVDGGSDGTGGRAEPVEEVRIVEFDCGDLLAEGPDKDHDGVPGGATQRETKECAKANQGSYGFGPDCDDTDASVFSEGFIDTDGDGWGNPELPVCFGYVRPPGVSDNPLDCDDEDPQRNSMYPYDADGDGFAGTASACIDPDHPPEGHSFPSGFTSTDCDDDDAAIYPSGLDFFGDGIDGNCDGVDGLPVAEGALAMTPVELDPICMESSALFVISVRVYSDCGGVRSSIEIGNRGGEPSVNATLTVHDMGGDFEDWTIALQDLAPGTTTRMASLGRKIPEQASVILDDPGASSACHTGPTDVTTYWDCEVP